MLGEKTSDTNLDGVNSVPDPGYRDKAKESSLLEPGSELALEGNPQV